MNLRELRLLHWRQLGAVRQMQKNTSINDHAQQAKLQALAMEHLGAVQCLNDVVSGTAEQDDDASVQAVSDAPSDDIDIAHGAKELSELVARYAAKLERQPGVPLRARAELARELASILFRSSELGRCASPSSSG